MNYCVQGIGFGLCQQYISAIYVVTDHFDAQSWFNFLFIGTSLVIPCSWL